MGAYFGIFNNGKLVAVTGERMKMQDATEISAVVTHPDYSGRGYAKQLVAFVAHKIQMEHKLPFLHVAETNIPAIGLYEKLGFEHRIKMNFLFIVGSNNHSLNINQLNDCLNAKGVNCVLFLNNLLKDCGNSLTPNSSKLQRIVAIASFSSASP